MKSTEIKIDEYYILVKETQDQHIIEWSGSLTLIPQESGDTFVDISFNDEEIYRIIQDQPFDPDIAELSIELIDFEILPAIEA